jgi:hypothetical protein
MGSGTAVLLTAVISCCLNAEQPILRLHISSSFEGPALSLECVSLLKADPTRFLETVRSKPLASRRTCVNQLLQSLTPEPEFTEEDFRKATADGSFRPENPELNRRMGGRLAVNWNVANALAQLGSGGLIEDPSAVSPLIQCLKHPWLEVSQRCEDTLVAITRHSYGWTFYYDQPPPPTEESRQRFIADWTEWEQQMKSGHPIFDEWLATECLNAIHQLGTELTVAWKGTVAASYIDNLKKEKVLSFGNGFSSIIFQFRVGRGNAANWAASSKIDWVEIKIFRPGIPDPRSISPKYRLLARALEPGNPATPESLYRESFPALDLEADIEIDTLYNDVRNLSFLAVRRALDGLREANKVAVRPRL